MNGRRAAFARIAFLVNTGWLGIGLLAPTGPVGAAAAYSPARPPAHVTDDTQTARLPLFFVPNVGQSGPANRFTGFVPGATVGFEAGGVTYDLTRSTPPAQTAGLDRMSPGRPAPTRESLRVRATFPGANPAPEITGESALEHRSNFYLGNDPRRWRTGVPSYGAVRFHDLYPGVDLEYHGNGCALEYDFHVAPGADSRRIRVRYEGVERLAVSSQGELEVTTRFGRGIEAAPVAYQIIAGERRPVRARYRLVDAHTFGFAIDDRLDPTAELVIDPILIYSRYIGGISYDEVHGIVSDVAGNAYIVGGTMSPDFPATGSPVPSGNYSVFVTKVSPNGSSLVWSVFLGGSDTQIGYGIELDAAGNVYVAGVTGSNDFPTTAGAYDVTFNGASSADGDLFVAKLSPSATLLYGTYFGGPATDWGGVMALDSQNDVCLLTSAAAGYPVTAGAYDVTYNGLNDVAFTKLKLAGGGASDLLYSTFLGGSGDDEAYDLTLDNADDVYITGSTRSNNFPASGGPPFNGTFDAFVVKLRPLGLGVADLIYGTKLGGSAQDYGGGIAVDGSGQVYLVGSTASANFTPILAAYQPVYGGGSYDAWVAILLADGSTVMSGTYLGSTGEEHGLAVELDPAWNPVVTGMTNSSTFPVTGGAYDPTFNGNYDVFITQFTPLGNLIESTFYGGSDADIPYALTIDNGGRWYLTGTTLSADFPSTIVGSSYSGGTIDVWVAKFATQGPDTCALCASPADTCCTGAPTMEGVPASGNILVGTRQPVSGYPYSLSIFDLGSPLPSPLEDQDWASINRFNGPANTWNADSLGTVFGLTLDKYGNIFVTHTSCYSPDLVGQVFGAAPGAVYRVDGATGKITTFCVLPNLVDGSVAPGENFPGLGNITYDCRHDQFFVTDLEDGKIYRLKATGVNGPTGTVQQTFDPLAADNGAPGWAPLGERLWGVQWHGDRLYYAVWVEDLSAPSATAANEIRSVALLPSGAIDTSVGSDRRELYLPPLNTYNWSMPVSDISFSAGGKMLLGERGIMNTSLPAPHLARVLEYTCNAGCWVPANAYGVGQAGPQNAAGGVDYDRDPFVSGALGRIWASGDAIHDGATPYTDVIYGYQGFRPSGGSILNSMIVDSDGNPASRDKSSVGDVEAPGCSDPSLGAVCGLKFLDLNHNGIKDGTDPPLAGWTIVLTGPGGPYTAVTDAQGNYCFTNKPPGSYTLAEVGQPTWLQTAPAGGTYAFTLAAGQTLTGQNFGNYPGGPSAGCVLPPPGMVAWWPFREIAGATSSADVTHQTPAKNVMQTFGGAAVATGGMVGNDLCVGPELEYAKVPYANQAGLNFGTGPFAIDVWVEPAALGGGTPRMIAEKRVLVSSSPYRTRGWALYLNGLQCTLELGIGISTQILTGPTLPAGVWSHLAVSVGRTPAQGRWYLNGAPLSGFDFVPTPGGTQSNADLYVGQVSPPFGIGPGLQGCIDELEIFNTPLTPQSVLALHAAGAGGKCLEYCRLPEVATICKDQTSITVCMSLCNNHPTAQTYHWSLAGVPVGPGCGTAGPTVFAPPAGAVSVPANSCAPICVTIPRPPTLNFSGATACYAFTFVNDTTGVSYSCQGTIRADYSCWCAQAVQPDIVGVAARLMPGQIGIPIGIGIGLPCGGVGGGSTLSYRVRAQYDPSSPHLDPLDVSLNGLPPGEPVLGETTLEPGQSDVVTVYVSTPNGYDPAGLYEILFDADTDGDGVPEDLCGTRIASLPDTALDLTRVPGGERLGDSVRLLTSPNPFFGGSAIAFSLAVPTDVELGVYDIGGRLVQRVFRGRLAAGAHHIAWDGRDAARRKAPAGVYFVRLDSPRLHLDAKIVKLR